ncbi:hypothetical protein Tco_0017438, partial [Tanacetum coccineum]
VRTPIPTTIYLITVAVFFALDRIRRNIIFTPEPETAFLTNKRVATVVEGQHPIPEHCPSRTSDSFVHNPMHPLEDFNPDVPVIKA